MLRLVLYNSYFPGLMINLTPNYCKKDPKLRYAFKKFNTYFDERTIFMKKIPNPLARFDRKRVLPPYLGP